MSLIITKASSSRSFERPKSRAILATSTLSSKETAMSIAFCKASHDASLLLRTNPSKIAILKKAQDFSGWSSDKRCTTFSLKFVSKWSEWLTM